MERRKTKKATMNIETFKQCMITLSEYFGKDLSPIAIEAYHDALGDFSDDEMRRATKLSLKTKQFMPKAVELVELVRGGAQDASIEALERVEYAFKAVGKYRSVDFEDKAINATVRLMGGWPELCELTEDEWRRFRSKDFQKIYASMRSKPVPTDTGLALPGIAEAENLKGGRDVEAPMLVERRQGSVGSGFVADPTMLGDGDNQ
jgi:hypothetical protein